MQNKTKIILIRHGESLGNANRTMLGHTDLDLSPLGYTQAETTANHLKNEKIDAIYSSDLIRAIIQLFRTQKCEKLRLLSPKCCVKYKLAAGKTSKSRKL